MSINPLYVPPAPPPAASAPAEPTSTTVSPETANLVVAYHDTQLAMTGVIKVSEQVAFVSNELETSVVSLFMKLIEEQMGVPRVYVTQGDTLEQQAAALLAEASKGLVSTPSSATASPPLIPVSYLGNTFLDMS